MNNELIEIGRATLKVDEVTEKKYWHVYFVDDKEGSDLNDDEMIKFNPNAFEEGCIIRIEELNNE